MVETLSKNKIKWIKSLHHKKHRDSEGVFVVEGDKMVSELIEFWKDQIDFICTSDPSFKFDGHLIVTDEKTIKEIKPESFQDFDNLYFYNTNGNILNINHGI